MITKHQQAGHTWKKKGKNRRGKRGDIKTYDITETSTDHQKKTWKGGYLTACMPLPQAL
jgi:hypothetical protein